MKKAIILSDGKPGHYNQSLALCRHLGLEHDTVEVSYPTGAGKALSYLFDKLGLYTDTLYKSSPSHPGTEDVALIVSTGSTTYYPSKLLAQKSGLPNVAILYPKSYKLDFSHIICPAYDHPPEQENITTIPLNLCAADTSFFDEKVTEFKTKHTQQKPAIGIIIGGPNAISTIDKVTLRQQLVQLFDQTEGMERWLTTSRRTPSDITLLVEEFPFDYKLIASRDSYNPIPAFIAQCEHLCVTSDSASMISECVSFGNANVNVLMNRQKKSPNKFEELIHGLAAKKALHLFDGTLGDACQKIDIGPTLREVIAPLLR